MPVFQVLPNYRATAFIGILLLSLISTIQNTAEALDNIGSQNNVVQSNLDLNSKSNIDISTGKDISLLTGRGNININATPITGMGNININVTPLALFIQQTDGEIHSDLLAASFNAHRLTRQAVFGRLSDIRIDRSSYMTGIKAQNLEAQANKNLWVRGMGGFTTTNGDRQANGFNESLYGVMLGSDYAITDNLQLGAAIGYVQNLVNVSPAGNGTTDSIQFLGYGLWQRNTEFLNFAFGYGRDNYTSQRTFNFGGINTYKTNVDGNSGSLDVEAGTRRSIGKFTIEPSFGVRGDIISRDAFNEGGLVGLTAKSTTLSAAQTRLGTKLSHGIDFGVNKRITPELRAYWLHDEGDSIASQSQATLLGQSLNIIAANAGRDAASLGAGLKVELGKNVALIADYNYEHRNAANGQNIFGGVRLNW